MRTLDLLIGLALFTIVPAVQQARAARIPKDPSDITQEINLRCMYDMGEFGQVGMEACVRADLAAVEALKHYPPESQPIIDRCFLDKWKLGYSVVQQCVDEELSAKND